MSTEQATLQRVPVQARRVAEPSTRAALLVIGAATLVAVASVWLMLTSPNYGSFDSTGWWIGLATGLFTIGAGLVGWRERPGNRVGPLMIIAGFAGFMSWLSHSGHPVIWTVGNMWYLLGSVAIAHVYLAFPQGRTRGWSRVLVIAIYVWFFAVSVSRQALREYPGSWPWQNPFVVWPSGELSDAIQLVGYVGALVLAILVGATAVGRWRRGSPAVRRALVPVFLASPFYLLFNGIHFIGHTGGSDELIELSTLPVFASTGFILPAAFLVGLLRTRLDQASIADLLRDLDDVAPGDLERALAEAVRDRSLQLAFPMPDGTGYVDTAGHKFELPANEPFRAITKIGPDEQPLAILLHDPAIESELIESAAAASHLALENARLTAELRAQLEAVRESRLRIVQAADEERRRLERDLHDGAQQRLVTLGFALRDATRRARGDQELTEVLEVAQQELETGLRELRAIARGLHPTALDDGLGPAIRELADRSPVPIEVELEEVALPGSVETTAYFIAAEALTNALRHAQASRISVTGTAHGGRYRLVVNDDGRGGAEGTTDGSGMRGLRDRAQALGGTLRVESPMDAGTTVIAELPLR